MHRPAHIALFCLLALAAALGALSPAMAGAPGMESRLSDVYLFYRDADGGEHQVALQPGFTPDVQAYSGVVPSTAVAAIGAAVLGAPDQTVRVNGIEAPGDGIFAQFDSPLSGVPATVEIEVTAGDGETRSVYTFSLVRPPSAESNLAALALSAGTLSPEFSPGIRHYFATVPKVVSTIAVTATHSDPDGTISVQGAAAASGQPSEPVPLPVVAPGVNAIDVVATAADELSSSPYRIEITRERGMTARLIALDASPDVDWVFDPDYTSYTATVNPEVSSLQVIALAEDPDAQITWSGNGSVNQPVAHGEALQIPLHVGINDFRWRVVSEDLSTSKIYFVTVYRRQDPAVQLVSVQSSAGCCVTFPAFPEQTVFRFYANGTQRSVSFSAATLDSDATMVFGGEPLAQSANVDVDLSVPRPQSNPLAIPLVVTSADGLKTFEYTVEFVRDPSTVAYLASLDARVDGEAVALTPGFQPQTYLYRMQVAVGESVSFTLAPEDPIATITASGEITGPIPAGAPTAPHVVRQGFQVFYFTVRAESGAIINYTVEVVGGVSTENRLESLVFSVGSLTPEFSAEVNSYALSVPAGTQRLWAQGIPLDPTASIALDGTPAGAGGFMDIEDFVDGQALDFRVTSASGATRSYLVTVSRPNAAPRISARTISSFQEDGHDDISILLSDVETPARDLRIEAISLDQALIRDEDLAASFTGTDAARSLRIAARPDQFGATEVVLTVSDPEGLSTQHRIAVFVAPVNDAPSFDLELAEVRLVPGREIRLPGAIRNLVPGPANELDQQVSIAVSTSAMSGDVPAGWTVELIESVPGAFDVVLDAPAVASFDALVVAFTAQDDGGTQFGVNQSAPQVLHVRAAEGEDVDVVANIERTVATSTERRYEATIGNAGTVYAQDVMVELLGPVELSDVLWRCVTTTVGSTCSVEIISERPFARLGLHPGALAIVEAVGRVGVGAFARVEVIARPNGLSPVINPDDDRAVFEDVIEPYGIFRGSFEQ